MAFTRSLPIPFYNLRTVNKPLNFPYLEQLSHQGRDKAFNYVFSQEVYSSFIPYVVQDPIHTTQDPESVRIVCMSDTHGFHAKMPYIPEGDVLLFAGDLTHESTHKEIGSFFRFLDTLPHPVKIIVGGNHDFVLDELWYNSCWPSVDRFHQGPINHSLAIQELRKRGIYLEDQTVNYKGITIHGILYLDRYHYYHMESSLPPDQIKDPQFSNLPSKVDVLITHYAPFGRCDCDPDKHNGSISLLRLLRTRITPRVHLFGHCHDGYGASFDGKTLYLNTAAVNDRYHIAHSPVVLDLPLRHPHEQETLTQCIATAAHLNTPAFQKFFQSKQPLPSLSVPLLYPFPSKPASPQTPPKPH